MADTDTWVVPQRWLPLRGALNFRDIGGYPTRSGRTVAWGRLFRSDSLDELDLADQQELGGIGLRSVIDLRCREEYLDERPDCGATRYELAVFDFASTEPVFVPGVPLADAYLLVLRARATSFRRAIEMIAEAEMPLVFHCTAGKDRTGLLAAVLLGTLGVSDTYIAKDYALSAIVLPDLLESAEFDTMETVLERINHEHGSMLGYALDIGVDPTAIDALYRKVIV